MDAWTSKLGVEQGRIVPTGWTAPEGSYVVALGSDLPGRTALLGVGDYFELSRLEDLTGVAVVRAQARLRAPSVIPAGAAWEFSLRVDGTARVTHRLAEGRTRDLRDLATNVSALTGTHRIAFRLELVAG